MRENGITLVALIVTIIIVILLAVMGGFYTNDVFNTTERMDVEEELRNVEELVSVQAAKIKGGSQTLPETYVATNAEIDSFNIDTSVLSSDEVRKIKSTNSSEVSAEYKYHLMNQAAFNAVFGDDINVRKVKREYLINFDERVVILKANGKLYKAGRIETE
ncbi:MAG: hypothetical protein IJ217_05140 [Clostridia bacterium]|nr:hypothetical protein [Clostridia bacterium]